MPNQPKKTSRGNNSDLAIGMRLREKRCHRIFTVADIFPSGEHGGMILTWITEDGRERGQAFTRKNWADRWEVVHA